jgi:nucleotide-binding universal stress UspA family protein
MRADRAEGKICAQMPPTILIGFDDRPQDADALHLGVELATLTGGALAIAHVINTGPAVNWHPRDDFERTGRQEPLERARALLGPELEARSSFHTRSGGSAADEIEVLAEELDAFLIVVGPAHRGPIGRSLLGTTAGHLLHIARRPIAVAPEHHTDDRLDASWPVVVAFDGSRESQAAVTAARALATAAGRPLRIATVAEMTVPAHAPDLPGAGEHRLLVSERAGEVMAEGVKAGGEGAEGKLLEGHAALELAAESVEAQMLVIGSRRGRMRRGALGGVPTALVSSSACPLIVIPRGVKPDLLVAAVSRPAQATR